MLAFVFTFSRLWLYLMEISPCAVAGWRAAEASSCHYCTSFEQWNHWCRSPTSTLKSSPVDRWLEVHLGLAGHSRLRFAFQLRDATYEPQLQVSRYGAQYHNIDATLYLGCTHRARLESYSDAGLCNCSPRHHAVHARAYKNCPIPSPRISV